MDRREKYILWLPSWYPSKCYRFLGDYIQRHAEAASLYCNVHVVYIVKDTTGIVTKTTFEETNMRGKLRETIIYYYAPEGKPAALFRLFSHHRYKLIYRRVLRNHIAQFGLPCLVNVHIQLKAGILALWMKKQYGIPYVVSEQSSMFLPGALFSASNLTYQQKWIHEILSEAEDVSCVSEYLGRSINTYHPLRHFEVIPNVVNTEIFRDRGSGNSGIPQFVHVSTLDRNKNIIDILKAFSILRSKKVPFQFDVFGPANEGLETLAARLEISDSVVFHGEVSQPRLAAFVERATALILYSGYETFGCVVIEANACGVPVIASDIPTMREIVENRKTGLLVNGSDPTALAMALQDFAEKKLDFDRAAIARRTVERYSYAAVGSLFDNWYKRVTQGNC